MAGSLAQRARTPRHDRFAVAAILTDVSSYSVAFLGRENPCRDRDACAVRLRVVCDHSYFQFFRAVAPGIDVARLQPRPGDDWWKALAMLAAREVENVIRAGFHPLADPTEAVLIAVDANEAHRVSRAGEPLVDLNVREEYVAGVRVSAFSL